MSNKPIVINAEQAFESAVEFKTLGSVDPSGPQYLNADLVNKAFAIEVYLKCLYAIENPVQPADGWLEGMNVAKEDVANLGYGKRGHKLKELFDGLSEESKGAITNAVNTAINAGPSQSGFRVMDEDGELPQFANIDEVLSVVNNVFAEMRYSFELAEEPPKSVVYLDELLAAIEERILNLKPVFQIANLRMRSS